MEDAEGESVGAGRGAAGGGLMARQLGRRETAAEQLWREGMEDVEAIAKVLSKELFGWDAAGVPSERMAALELGQPGTGDGRGTAAGGGNPFDELGSGLDDALDNLGEVKDRAVQGAVQAGAAVADGAVRGGTGILGHLGRTTIQELEGSQQAVRRAVEAVEQGGKDAHQAWRDLMGGSFIRKNQDVIEAQARAQRVDVEVLHSILWLESAAVERLGNATWLEELNRQVRPGRDRDFASIGPAQMQVRRARELEERGYVRPRSDSERIHALYSDEGAVEYAAGMVEYLQDIVRSAQDARGLAFEALSLDDQRRLVLIGYNLGPEGLLETIQERTFQDVINERPYGNEAIGGYRRWTGARRG